MFKRIHEDIDSVLRHDRAARSRLAVFFCYPGFHALLFHRVAHRLWRHGWHFVAIWLAYVARIATGIEIHPGATIGRHVFIDHGNGVVIGETAEIGDGVVLYQGVTLGGTSLDEGKRHPTLGRGVVVGAGAKLLGPVIVGADARIGSNAVVLKDVAEGATMVGIPARPVPAATKPVFRPHFVAFGTAGTAQDDLSDPVARALGGLIDEVTRLRHRIDQLEREREREATGRQPAGLMLDTVRTGGNGAAEPSRPDC